MALKKFRKLKNIGKFADSTARGDVELRSLTLMFGENARGKTTLCGVLRSLATGDANYIAERETLGATDAAEAEVLTASGMSLFSSGAWDTTLDNVSVFDNTFVHENVYAGERVDHEHKKNLHRVIVGKQGIDLNRKVTELDSEIRDVGGELRTAKAEVTKYIPKGISLDAFLALEKDADIEARIAECQNQVDALKRSDDIQKKSKLSLVSAPALPDDFEAILGKTLPELSSEAEELLKKHLEDCTHGATQEWLSSGTKYQKDSDCPYCGQDTSGVPLVAAYQEYFSKAYADHIAEVRGLKQRLENQFGQAASLTAARPIASNQALKDFWQEFVELSSIEFPEEVGLAECMSKLYESASSYAETKVASPLESVTPGTDYVEAVKSYQEVLASIEKYNIAAEAANKLIQERKDNTEGGNLAAKEKELALLTATKIRHEKETIAKALVYTKLQAKKTQLEIDKTDAREKLGTYSETVFTKYKDRINELLEDFKASFRLADIAPQFQGGQPSAPFDILIRNQRVPIGKTDTPPGTPCFGSTLSAGDRSTLALAFFLAQLEQDPNYKLMTVIFDDPFTSQDRFRRTRTQQLICDKARECAQVLVLSHDPDFLKLIWDNYNTAEIKTLRLTRVNRDDATITEWDIVEATKSGFVQDYMAIMAFLHRNEGTPKDIARKLRPVLEGSLRHRFPPEFPEGKWLGQLIEQIREADNTSPLYVLHGEPLNELASINDFSKTFHHETNVAGWDSAIPDEDELAGFAEKTIRFVGGF